MQQENEKGYKISMTKSVIIALLVVSAFSVVSVMIMDNVDGIKKFNSLKRANLPDAKEFIDFLV